MRRGIGITLSLLLSKIDSNFSVGALTAVTYDTVFWAKRQTCVKFAEFVFVRLTEFETFKGRISIKCRNDIT